MPLRDYQDLAMTGIRQAFFELNHKRVLLDLATGGGKTVIFCEILKRLDASIPALIVVKGKKLVNQASERLFREKVPHGVLMANHWNYRPNEKKKVCSIDTLIARKLVPPADVIIIDEAHMATSDGYREFLSHYPDALILSVTATPWPLKPLGFLADVVVKPISVGELMAQGYLVRPRYFAPYTPDLSGVDYDKKTGDFNQVQLREAIDKGELIGNILEHWVKMAEERPTIIFAGSVAHSMHIANRFTAAGYPFAHCDADTPDAERERILQKVQERKLYGISNVNIFATGADMPYISCIVSARPTKSPILYIQQMGRGTRPVYAEGMPLDTVEQRLDAIAKSAKKDFIILDHAGNIHRHGFITEERKPNTSDRPGIKLMGFEVNTESVVVPFKTCPSCLTPYRGEVCPTGAPGCIEAAEAAAAAKREEDRKELEGKLKELTDLTPEELYIQQLKLRAKRGNGVKAYHSNWVYYRFEERFGKEAAQKHFPNFGRQQIAARRQALSNEADAFLKKHKEREQAAVEVDQEV